MKVWDSCGCRLGNALFRYMASSLFCIIYNGVRTYDVNECNSVIDEGFFHHWCNNILNNNIILNIDTNLNYKFPDFYQTDVYKLYRNELIEWFINHPDDTVYHGDTFDIKYRIGDLFTELKSEKKYDIVIHLRLEDLLTINEKIVIHPNSICEILDKIDNIDKSMSIVCNHPTKEIEIKYIDYIKNKYNCIVESNDLITDFKIMNNAKVLICGISTIAWTAGFLSKNLQQVYFPKNKFHGWYNQTFSTIIDNTIYYDNILVNKEDLELFFN